MKCKKGNVKVVIEIDKTAYNVLCASIEPEIVARIYYNMELNKFVQTLICSSLPLPKNKDIFQKIESDLWDAGVNMGGEYQGVWVRFKDIEKVFDKYYEKEKGAEENETVSKETI